MQSQDQIWDPEHDWILHFERILKPGGALASSALEKNDTAKFRHHHEGTVSCIRPSIKLKMSSRYGGRGGYLKVNLKRRCLWTASMLTN